MDKKISINELMDKKIVRIEDGQFAPPPDPDRLPKVSIIITRPDGKHMICSFHPTDEELRLMTMHGNGGILSTYFEPALMHMLQSYRSVRA